MRASPALVTVALASSPLMARDLPESVRLKRLTPHFSPAPGQMLEIDPRELRDAVGRKPPGALRGYVTIAPPKGQCFTVTRKDDEPDEEICKKTTLAFKVDELDRAGRLHWRVVAGEGDLGTDLFWPTPYRLGVTAPAGSKPDAQPVYRFLGRCTATRSESGRRIALDLLDGARWIIRFPDEDVLLPQPDPLPNLQQASAVGKVGVKDAQASKDAEAAAAASEHGEAPKAEGGEHAAAVPKKMDEPLSEGEDRTLWSIPRRDSYEMNAAAFMPFGSVSGRIKGRCRYNFAGPPEDPDTGRIECKDADGFREVYLPLTCLGALRARQAR